MVLTPKFSINICQPVVAYKELTAKDAKGAKKIKGVSSRILREEFPHLKEWCGDNLWAPSCFHGSVGNGWEVVSKYIETQDFNHARNDMYRPCHRVRDRD